MIYTGLLNIHRTYVTDNNSTNYNVVLFSFLFENTIAQSAGAVEYTNCTSAEG